MEIKLNGQQGQYKRGLEPIADINVLSSKIEKLNSHKKKTKN
jgi:hypothetical protein